MKLATTAAILAIALSAFSVHAEETGVAAEAKSGTDKAYDVYEATVRETGMSGLEDAVVDCYKKQAASPSVVTLSTCASLDKRAADDDAAFAAQHGLRVGFFAGSKPANRMRAALKKMALSDMDRREVMRVIAGT